MNLWVDDGVDDGMKEWVSWKDTACADRGIDEQSNESEQSVFPRTGARGG